MEHREIKTPEQIAALKAKSPGGYRNLRETVVNELFPTPITSDYKNGKSSSGYGANLPETAKTLMPTPTTRDYKDGSQPHQRDGKVQTDTVARAVFNSGEVLLGTPRATAANSSSKQVELGAPKARIEDQVKLFNTPTTMDAKATNNPEIAQKFLDQGRQTCLTYDVATNWGKFEPAIRRWEAIIGRQAPEPTKPDGKEGNHRLSSKFTEWMMGLPDGWITDIGLKRNDELKACGNGVVPQQAELALSLLGIKEILER
jgi:DNA (cytosine-5)-methyltransferase 1